MDDIPNQDNITPSNGKGKEREKDNDSIAKNSKSMADRLQASGRLALNAFGTGPDLRGQQLSSKASGSSGNISSIDQSSSYTAGEASSQRLRSTGIGESLRSQAPSSAQAFDQFASAEPTLDPIHAAPDVPHIQQLGENTTDTLQSRPSDVAMQERADGDAVVGLLSGPSDELDAVLLGAQDPEAQDDFLTPEAADQLREALFPPNTVSSGPRWEDLLNFNPDFLTRGDAEADFERQLHMGTPDATEARYKWLNQWSDVLSSYTDQVWGDLEPLIAEAKKEVEEIAGSREGGTAAPETKALERLRQILAHVRGF